MSYVEKLATEMVASDCSLAQVEKTADNIKVKLGEQQLDKFITALFKASHVASVDNQPKVRVTIRAYLWGDACQMATR